MKEERPIYDRDTEEMFLSQATMDLKQGLTTYVYKEHYLEKLKEIFKDLEIRRNSFYWAVRRVSK